MKRYGLFAAALFLIAVGPVGSLFAQPQVPGGGARRPTYSPYLGLLAGGGGNPAFNYFGIVQPNMQAQQQFGALQGMIQQNAQNIQSINNNVAYGVDQNFPLTGHAATFGNLSHYYSYGRGIAAGSGGSSRGASGGISGGTSMGMNRPAGAPSGGRR